VSSDLALADALSLQWQTLARRRNSRAADEADSLATVCLCIGLQGHSERAG
jgi:hypothetical protein